MNIKNGTKLTVRKNLSETDNSDNGITNDMVEYAGKNCFVEKYVDDDLFYINIDEKEYMWEKSMFESVSPDEVTISKARYKELLKIEMMYKVLCK